MDKIDIHTVINEAIEKKDRFVHIFIMKDNISVDVKPLSESDPRWIVHDRSERFLRFECSECRSYSQDPSPYCPICGEKLRMPVKEENSDGKT